MPNGIIEQKLEFDGNVYILKGTVVLIQVFGTTMLNHGMHWSWSEITPKKDSSLETFLTKYGYKR